MVEDRQNEELMEEKEKCACGHDHCHEHCHHNHDHEDKFDLEDILPENMEEYTITMADAETGEEFNFYMADDFEMDGTVYVVLLSVEEDPEALFAKVVPSEEEGGDDGFETLDDEEFERVADYYEKLCAEAAENDDYDEEDEEDDEEEDEE